jgi:hypothetical protein
MKPVRICFRLLLLPALVYTSICIYGFSTKKPVGKGLSVESKKANSGYTYTIFYKNDLLMDVSLKRPDIKDPNTVLCIAGAYTDLQNYTVDGLYIDNGKVYNKNKVNHSLGGAIKIINGECEIFPTRKGQLLNDSLINIITAKKGSLFQQIQMVEKGTAAKYKDKKLFQRRAIVKFKGNKTAVIECFEHITLTAFTKDLVEFGVVDALYTDMGSWDEGWYKAPASGKIITIGRMKMQTDKQCNWVVFKIK